MTFKAKGDRPNGILTIELSPRDEDAIRQAAKGSGLDVLTFIQNAIAAAVLKNAEDEQELAAHEWNDE